MTEPQPTGYWPPPAGAAPADYPTLPGYEIVEELGRGGMGIVYQARQVSLNRLVALKLIRDGSLAGPEDRTRFRLEAETAARMQHPNIVSIYEVGDYQGQLYFAMELVEGGSLEQHLAGRPQPALQATALLRTLALAIHHAHEMKVIHRDLKPANILLSRKADSRTPNFNSNFREAGSDFGLWMADCEPKVTDFGLAKRLDSESTALTREGAVLGTASYMAPEQAAGDSRALGPAADVYALGAILYEMLTGRPPFAADSWNQLLEQVLHNDPTPPTRLHAAVPRDLETVCLKCLEKDAARRYGSAAELADDLDRFLQGKPVAAVPVAATERLGRLAARDGYQLSGAIGHGPHSTVYRALDGPLRQPVALKVFSVGWCTQEEWEAWLRLEAGLWSWLTHPHLLPVQRAGWWDGAPYLVMEYIPHGNLAARLTGKPFPIRPALRLLEQLVEVISYLHRQGVVHGNLKPSNVLLAGDEIPRVSDLRPSGGLFQRLLSANDSEPASPGYLTPEQVENPAGEPRPYTDIYGLGLILYELLTGQAAFKGATAQETQEQVRSQAPVPPSRHNSQVTPQLEAFCLRCLNKNPWRRFSRAYDLLAPVRSFRDDPEGRAVPGERRPHSR